jgi:hypothetical protein
MDEILANPTTESDSMVYGVIVPEELVMPKAAMPVGAGAPLLKRKGLTYCGKIVYSAYA